MKKIISILLSLILVCGLACPVFALEAHYVNLGVPQGLDTSFKAYEPYTAITSKSSSQYKFIYNSGWVWTDNSGFLRANGERDLGITDDYYLIALGSYYGTTIGTKYRIK